MVPNLMTASIQSAAGHGAERRVSVDRREYTLASLWQAIVHPRRMAGRRREDRRFAVLDRFDSGLLALATLLMGLSVLDAGFTLTLLARGGSELNPVMNWLLNYSIWAFTGVKMLLTGIPAVILAATGNLKLFGRFRARSMLAALVGVYGGLIVYELALLSLT